MKKFSNLRNRLISTAQKSPIAHQHAAVVIYKGSPVSWGFNHIKGKKTFHAESSALHSFLTSQGFQKFALHQQRVLWGHERKGLKEYQPHTSKGSAHPQENIHSGYSLERNTIYNEQAM